MARQRANKLPPTHNAPGIVPGRVRRKQLIFHIQKTICSRHITPCAKLAFIACVIDPMSRSFDNMVP